MLAKLKGVEKRFLEIEEKLSQPSVVNDREAYQKYVREHAELGKIVAVYREFIKAEQELEESRDLLNDPDPDIRGLASDETDRLNAKKEALENDLKLLLVPKDPNDNKNVILEIRAGTGGEEAGLFAGDLFRMYGRYAENRHWKVEILSQHATGVGGFKEVVAMVQGEGAYSALKYESGTHRVQRVQVTETQGRIHTSTVTVAVLPEAEEVEVSIDPNEIKVDVFRSTGPGGQSVNTTDSAVRITHIPTGMVVTCQDEKSQHKNKAKAMKVLLSRLLEKANREQADEIAQARKGMVGSGDRSAKIRTYNFPQGRVSDHRIGFTSHNLGAILDGELDELISELALAERENLLAQAVEREKKGKGPE